MTNQNPKTVSMLIDSGHGASVVSQGEVHTAIKGVSILGFTPQSSAEKAGMRKGDVIIDYDGAANLTTDRLAALTTRVKSEGTRIRVVLIRDDREHFVEAAAGSLGISAMDTTIRRFLGTIQSSLEISWDNTTPWTASDAWLLAGLFFLFKQLVALSLVMTHVPEMLCILMALEWKRTGWQAVGFRRFDRKAVKLVLKLLFLVYVIVGVNDTLLRYFHLPFFDRELFRTFGTRQSLWSMFPLIVVIAPLTEEMLFRGVLFAGFGRRYSWQTAVCYQFWSFCLGSPAIS